MILRKLLFRGMANFIQYLIPILLVLVLWFFSGQSKLNDHDSAVAEKDVPIAWKRHLVTKSGLSLTAVSIDVNGDKKQDVITSFSGKVSLFLAPDWNEEIIIHKFAGAKGAKQKCIHSAVLDVDGDGDLDWAGGLAGGNPFWLENPGSIDFKGIWKERKIDSELTAIHCLRTADVDNDGKDDLIINNFSPAKGIKDSIVWFSVPENPHTAEQWNRNVFADGDAVGGSHYMGAGDVDGDGWKEIAVGAKGGAFEGGNWFAFWKNPGKTNSPAMSMVMGKWTGSHHVDMELESFGLRLQTGKCMR